MINRIHQAAVESFDYARAFSRNRGLLSMEEQKRLEGATVAIAGAGGVGGWHALALARQGVSGFRLADPDKFDVVNFNRQAGANISTVGRSKTAVLKEMLLEINPRARIDTWEEALCATNADAFLAGADVAIDGLDIRAVPARREFFRAARSRGIWAMSAGPIGFGAAFLAFAPDGMSADEYFGFHDSMTPLEAFILLVVGVAPAGLHLSYLDLSELDLSSGAAPSSGAACMVCGALVATETVALLTGKRTPRPAPSYAQWDLMRGKLARGTVWGGASKNPLQRIRSWRFRAHLEKLGIHSRSVSLAWE